MDRLPSVLDATTGYGCVNIGKEVLGPKTQLFTCHCATVLPLRAGFPVDCTRFAIHYWPSVFYTGTTKLSIPTDSRILHFPMETLRAGFPVDCKRFAIHCWLSGGEPRNYPSTGSAVLLPLKKLEAGEKVEAEVLICGGAGHGAYENALRGQFSIALNSCARMKITDPNPTWTMETMPMPRTMGDMLVLPNGDVLIINGAKSGTAGWELGRDPALSPVIYHPDNVFGSRFEVTNASTIPRMYHSCAILLRDGRVLVGGSNPHQFYNFTNVLFPTDLSLEAFLPPYMDPTLSSIRSNISSPSSSTEIEYGKNLRIEFTIKELVNLASIKVTMVRPPFNTHSFSMSQRLLVLTNTTTVKRMNEGRFHLKVKTPGSSIIAPPGYYMLFVVHQNVPSQGIWVKIA